MLNYFKNNYDMIIISILIFLLIILTFTVYYTMSDIPNTKISEVNRIYDLLQQVTCELDRNDIKYTITSGTLLGSVRQKGHIPYDDDSDLGLIPEKGENITLFKQKVTNCLKVLEKNNIISYEHSVGNIIISQFRDSGTCVDMFILGEEDESNLFKYLKPFDTKYSNEYFNYSELFPLKDYTFGPLILKGPNNPYQFLDRAYPNWQTTASKWNHFRLVPKNSYQTDFKAVLPDPNNEQFPWIEKQCVI